MIHIEKGCEKECDNMNTQTKFEAHTVLAGAVYPYFNCVELDCVDGKMVTFTLYQRSGTTVIDGIYLTVTCEAELTKGYTCVNNTDDPQNDVEYDFPALEITQYCRPECVEFEGIFCKEGLLIELTQDQLTSINEWLGEDAEEAFLEGAEQYAEDARIERYIEKHGVY